MALSAGLSVSKMIMLLFTNPTIFPRPDAKFYVTHSGNQYVTKSGDLYITKVNP